MSEVEEAEPVEPLTITVRAVYGRFLPPYLGPALVEKTKPSKYIFERRRLNTHAPENEEVGPQGPDRAYFLPGQGLVGHDMYHTDYTWKSFTYEERAVLMQSIETYLKLSRDEKVGKYFHMYHADTEGESIELILEKPNFGEQLIVEGCETSQLCIGDVFEVEGGASTLKLEVTSPRLPCNYVDRKFESPFGSKGVKRHTLDEAAAGWFCRVLNEGQLVDGMKMHRTAQPNPEWTLTRCATALYGNKANRIKYNAAKPSWGETIETLREFVELEQLGEAEWGEDAEELLEQMEKEAEEEAEEKAMFESESWCTNPFGDNAAMASVGACACLSPVVLGMLFNWNSVFSG